MSDTRTDTVIEVGSRVRVKNPEGYIVVQQRKIINRIGTVDRIFDWSDSMQPGAAVVIFDARRKGSPTYTTNLWVKALEKVNE